MTALYGTENNRQPAGAPRHGLALCFGSPFCAQSRIMVCAIMMTVDDTKLFFLLLAYLAAAVALLLIGYLAWGVLRRRRHNHRLLRARPQEHPDAWRWSHRKHRRPH